MERERFCKSRGLASKEDANTKFTTVLRMTSGQECEPEFVLVEHAYARPWDWQADTSKSHPRKLLFLSKLPKTESDEVIDVMKEFPNLNAIPYDLVRGRHLMSECERHVDFAKLSRIPATTTGLKEEQNELNIDETDWEDSVNKSGWSEAQHSLFSRAVKIFDSDRLARLALKDTLNEPIKRRAQIDKTAAKFRQTLGRVNWNMKLVQWLHITFLQSMSTPYLASYLDVLQTLKSKIPNLVDKMILLSSTHKGPNVEALNLLLKRPWDPAAPVLNQQKPCKLDNMPIVIQVPSSVTSLHVPQTSRRFRFFNSQLQHLAKYIPVSISAESSKVENILEQIMCEVQSRISECKSQNPSSPIVLLGWGIGAVLACYVSLVEKVSANICLGFPMVDHMGKRGEADDPLLDMQTSTLFVIGERATNTSIDDIEDFRYHMQAETNLVVISGSDLLLRMSLEKRYWDGLTQSMVDRCIVDEIGDFLTRTLNEERRPPLAATSQITSRSSSTKVEGNVTTSSAATPLVSSKTSKREVVSQKKRKLSPQSSTESSHNPIPSKIMRTGAGTAISQTLGLKIPVGVSSVSSLVKQDMRGFSSLRSSDMETQLTNATDFDTVKSVVPSKSTSKAQESSLLHSKPSSSISFGKSDVQFFSLNQVTWPSDVIVSDPCSEQILVTSSFVSSPASFVSKPHKPSRRGRPPGRPKGSTNMKNKSREQNQTGARKGLGYESTSTGTSMGKSILNVSKGNTSAVRIYSASGQTFVSSTPATSPKMTLTDIGSSNHKGNIYISNLTNSPSVSDPEIAAEKSIRNLSDISFQGKIYAKNTAISTDISTSVNTSSFNTNVTVSSPSQLSLNLQGISTSRTVSFANSRSGAILQTSSDISESFKNTVNAVIGEGLKTTKNIMGVKSTNTTIEEYNCESPEFADSVENIPAKIDFVDKNIGIKYVSPAQSLDNVSEIEKSQREEHGPSDTLKSVSVPKIQKTLVLGTKFVSTSKNTAKKSNITFISSKDLNRALASSDFHSSKTSKCKSLLNSSKSRTFVKVPIDMSSIRLVRSVAPAASPIVIKASSNPSSFRNIITKTFTINAKMDSSTKTVGTNANSRRASFDSSIKTVTKRSRGTSTDEISELSLIKDTRNATLELHPNASKALTSSVSSAGSKTEQELSAKTISAGQSSKAISPGEKISETSFDISVSDKSLNQPAASQTQSSTETISSASNKIDSPKQQETATSNNTLNKCIKVTKELLASTVCEKDPPLFLSDKDDVNVTDLDRENVLQDNAETVDNSSNNSLIITSAFSLKSKKGVLEPSGLILPYLTTSELAPPTVGSEPKSLPAREIKRKNNSNTDKVNIVRIGSKDIFDTKGQEKHKIQKFPADTKKVSVPNKPLSTNKISQIISQSSILKTELENPSKGKVRKYSEILKETTSIKKAKEQTEKNSKPAKTGNELQTKISKDLREIPVDVDPEDLPLYRLIKKETEKNPENSNSSPSTTSKADEQLNEETNPFKPNRDDSSNKDKKPKERVRRSSIALLKTTLNENSTLLLEAKNTDLSDSKNRVTRSVAKVPRGKRRLRSSL